MKFIDKLTNEVREGRPAGEEKPACLVFNLLDEHAREFSYIHKLSKRKYTEREIEAVLEEASNSFKIWAVKKLLDYDNLNG